MLERILRPEVPMFELDIEIHRRNEVITVDEIRRKDRRISEDKVPDRYVGSFHEGEIGLDRNINCIKIVRTFRGCKSKKGEKGADRCREGRTAEQDEILPCIVQLITSFCLQSSHSAMMFQRRAHIPPPSASSHSAHHHNM